MTGRMTGVPCVLLMALLVAWSAFAEGQRKVVDFSGTWLPANPSTRKGEVKEILIVSQDKTGMTANFTYEGAKDGEVIRYEFDATKTQTGRAGNVEVSVTTSWQGESLVAINTVKVGDRVRMFEQVWSRDADGQLLIKVTRHSGGSSTSTTTVYRRQRSKSER